MLLMETGQGVCQILIPYAVKGLIDKGSKFSGSFETALSELRPDIVFFVSLSLGILLFSRASGAILVMTGPAIRRKVRQSIYHYLQFHSQRYFLSHFSGSLANRISEVSTSVAGVLWTVLFDFWPVLITFSVTSYLLFKASSDLALMLGGWIFIYTVVSFVLAMRCRKLAKQYAAARSSVSGKIVDSVTNMLNAKIFARLDFERKYLLSYLDTEVAAARKTFWFMEAMRWFQFLAAMVLQVTIIVMALNLWSKQIISVGSFAMVTSLSLLLINDARGLSRRFLEFFEYLGNISDGVGIIVKPHELLDRPGAQPLVVKSGEIEFDQVRFGYSPDRPVFSDLNVRIRAGERVGLVGFSGSGKTTFANLILRMFDLQGGEIRIDGQNLAQCTQDSLRAQISMIPQEPMLFHRTLLENIRYGRLEATDDEVYAAAKASRADEFIRGLPEGYQSLVGERGVKLSGGQRQRIAISRAVLKGAPILVLDEATSSLDSVTEKSIQDSLEILMRDKTVIVVAHRLSTIAQLHRILVFDNGKIVEDGTHSELLRRDGRYALMWKMQAGGFLPTSAIESEVHSSPRGP